MTISEFSAANIIALFSKLYCETWVAFECGHSWFNFRQHNVDFVFNKWDIVEEHPTYGGFGGGPIMYLFKLGKK